MDQTTQTLALTDQRAQDIIGCFGLDLARAPNQRSAGGDHRRQRRLQIVRNGAQQGAAQPLPLSLELRATHGAGELNSLHRRRQLIHTGREQKALLRLLLERNAGPEADSAQRRVRADHGHPNRRARWRAVFDELPALPGALREQPITRRFCGLEGAFGCLEQHAHRHAEQLAHMARGDRGQLLYVA